MEKPYQYSGILTITRNLCFCLSFCFLLYTTVTNVYSSKQKVFIKDNVEYNNHKQNKPKQNGSSNYNIFIFSLPRSGSSLLGEIFNRDTSNLYLYEPLHASDALAKLPLIRHQNKGGSTTIKVLQDLFQCNLQRQRGLFQFISYPELSNPHFRLMSHVLSSPPFCDYTMPQNSTELTYRKHCLHIDAKQLATICRDKKSVIIKDLLHRLPLHNPNEMLEFFQTDNMKSMWLVRDPRAIISSMINIGWMDYTFQSTLRASISNVCGLYENILETLLSIGSLINNNFIILRYEDLITQPFKTINRIANYTKISINTDTIDWLLQNTNGDVTGARKSESYSVLQRNSSYSMTSWRRFLNISHVISIQESCNNVMQHFGYVKFLNESILHDFKESSVSNSYVANA